MEIVIGLLIIAIGAFCQSSSYVPINKIKSWSWESYWLVQGVFAWLIFPVLGALLAVPAGHGLFELYAAAPKASLLTMFFGVLWGVGGLTFGLSMRYLGVALGQSIALGTCAGLGTIMGPVLLNMFFPEPLLVQLYISPVHFTGDPNLTVHFHKEFQKERLYSINKFRVRQFIYTLGRSPQIIAVFKPASAVPDYFYPVAVTDKAYMRSAHKMPRIHFP